MNKIYAQFWEVTNQMLEQELFQRLVIEVRAKNGMTPGRMNRALERLEKTGMTPDISQS
jgi:hypothetical protein